MSEDRTHLNGQDILICLAEHNHKEEHMKIRNLLTDQGYRIIIVQDEAEFNKYQQLDNKEILAHTYQKLNEMVLEQLSTQTNYVELPENNIEEKLYIDKKHYPDGSYYHRFRK